ncbi:unnamed protein product [Bursaphelenchus okinawaensis]|uniref:Uncharacterized protein n=1 Tax=Bursaphelenchus okinawaensis TaxID=465554 RepID=A0A811JV32_9BILA|nr:unnamed protein product [Bursaphelenchus okinawaensis]CAG9085298.1 unnamed protein product [Bursaphelenchus okinawaensis]
MGNNVLKYFLNNIVDQAWTDKYIKTFISLAGPWGGSVVAAKGLASGYNMGMPQYLVHSLELRQVLRSWSSTHFLMPSAELWSKDEFIMSTVNKNYSIHDIEAFFNDVNFTEGYQQYQKAKEGTTFDPPGVDIHCIYTLSQPTTSVMMWGEGQWPDTQPADGYGGGDLSVNARSLEYCKKWIGNNKEKEVS